MAYKLRRISVLALLMSLPAIVAVGCTCGRGSEGDGRHGRETVPEHGTGRETEAQHGERSESSDAPVTPAKSAEPEAVPNQVVIDNFTYRPRELTVSKGTKVTWVNRDDVPHTATSTARPKKFDSKTMDTDERFSFVFSTPGTYEYFCAVHPRMTGKIIVK